MNGHSSFDELLASAVRPFACLSEAQLAALDEHWRLLQSWNRKLNLTRIDGVETAVHRHYAESLFLGAKLAELVAGDSVTVADVGSGAGFPGVPIAVYRPDWQVLLIESHRRKAVFLAEVARRLPNVEVAARRFEDLSGAWDVVVSRAVAWPEISTRVSARARYLGLLAGPEEIAADLATPGFDWHDPISVPEPGRGFVLLASVQSST